MNETFNNLISYSPAPESLQEIKVLTANSPADYGNVNGGGVVSVLKSGTNQFHGSAYGYVQDYRFNANSWQNNHASPIIPINPLFSVAVRRHLRRPDHAEQAVLLCRLPGSALSQGGTGQASVFTQAMRNGDFSALLAGSNPIQLYDPLNGFAPYPATMACRSSTRWRSSSLRTRSFIRCRTRRRGWDCRQQPTGAAAPVTRPTTRATSRLSTIPGRRTRSRDSIPCRRRMTERPRCWRSPFRG